MVSTPSKCLGLHRLNEFSISVNNVLANTRLALPILRLQVKLGQCCTKLHNRTVLGMLFFYKKATVKLHRNQGQNQSPKTIWWWNSNKTLTQSQAHCQNDQHFPIESIPFWSFTSNVRCTASCANPSLYWSSVGKRSLPAII